MKFSEKLSGFIGKKIVITLHTEIQDNKPIQKGGILTEAGDDYIVLETFILDEEEKEVHTGEEIYMIRHIQSVNLFEKRKFVKGK